MTGGALVVGAGGQDGTLLRERLSGAVGVSRNDVDKLADTIAAVKPSAVYFLAAYHHSSADAAAASNDADVLRKSFAVHCDLLVTTLQAMASRAPTARLFYAASSHVFGAPATSPQTEATPFAPATPYAITKVCGVEICRYFRRKGIHASVGFLYNHESPLRPRQFVTQIVAEAVARAVIAGKSDVEITVGAPEAVVDWGWAPEYVDAMERIVALADPGEYIVATGVGRTVRALCETAGGAANVAVSVRADPGRIARSVPPLVGDASRLQAATGWQPRLAFSEWVGIMVEAARRRLLLEATPA